MPRRLEPEPYSEKIGQRIVSLRSEYDLTMEALANLAAISKGHLSSTERGLAVPTAVTLERLAFSLEQRPFVMLLLPDEDPLDALVDRIRKLSPGQRRRLQALVRSLEKEEATRQARRRSADKPRSIP